MRQGHAWVDALRIGRSRLLKPGPGLFRLAQTLVLMANLQHDLAVAWLQLRRFGPGPFRQIQLARAAPRRAIFQPNLGLARKLPGQPFISRQGLGKVEFGQKLASFVQLLYRIRPGNFS